MYSALSAAEDFNYKRSTSILKLSGHMLVHFDGYITSSFTPSAPLSDSTIRRSSVWTKIALARVA